MTGWVGLQSKVGRSVRIDSRLGVTGSSSPASRPTGPAQGPGRDHHVGGRDLAARRGHAADPPAPGIDRGDRGRLPQLAAELREAAGEAGCDLVGAAVARAGLVHHGRAVGDPEVRADPADVVGPDQAGLDPDLLVHAECPLDPVPALGRPDEQHAGPHEPAFPAHLVGPPLEDPAGEERHLGRRPRRVVGPHDRGGLRGGTGADGVLFEEHHPTRAPAGQVEGDAGAHDAAADDDDIRGLHEASPGVGDLCKPGRPRPGCPPRSSWSGPVKSSGGGKRRRRARRLLSIYRRLHSGRA